MVLVNLKRLIIIFIFLLLSTLFLIYISLEKHSAGFADFSITSQNILFWGIVITIIQILLFISTILSHKSIINNIGKITRIGDLSHPKVKKIMNSMGSLGNEIKSMIQEQNTVMELRANRISALNTLVKTLCNGYEESILITDINGDIISASNTLKNRLEKANKGLFDQIKNITDIRDDIPLQKILSYIEKQKISWQDKELKGIICSPVLDKQGNINFCLWEIESETFHKLKVENFTNKVNSRFIDSIKNKIFKQKKDEII